MGDIDSRMNELKRKRADAKDLLDDIRSNPGGVASAQLENLLSALKEQNERGATLNDKETEKEVDLDDRLRDLRGLLDSSQALKGLQNLIDDLQKQMEEDLASFAGVLDKTPKQIDMMLSTLQEMKNGSEPDDTADYWEERKKIEEQIRDLTGIKERLATLEKSFQKKSAEHAALQQAVRKAGSDVSALQKVVDSLQEAQGELQDQLNEAFDAKDEVSDIKKAMGDCDIPVNIQVRRNEVGAFTDRLNRIKLDFKDLK